MLTVCLHKHCAKDSFANAVRKVEKCVNLAPRRVENRPGEGPKWPPGSPRRAFGCQVRPIWPSRPLGNLIWAALGRAWGAPGGSWAALGASWAALRASWGAPGVHFGLPGVTFLSLLDLFLVSPCEIAKTLKFVDSIAFFLGFWGPGSPRAPPKPLLGPFGRSMKASWPP